MCAVSLAAAFKTDYTEDRRISAGTLDYKVIVRDFAVHYKVLLPWAFSIIWLFQLEIGRVNVDKYNIQLDHFHKDNERLRNELEILHKKLGDPDSKVCNTQSFNCTSCYYHGHHYDN